MTEYKVNKSDFGFSIKAQFRQDESMKKVPYVCRWEPDEDLGKPSIRECYVPENYITPIIERALSHTGFFDPKKGCKIRSGFPDAPYHGSQMVDEIFGDKILGTIDSPYSVAKDGKEIHTSDAIFEIDYSGKKVESGVGWDGYAEIKALKIHLGKSNDKLKNKCS